MRSPMSCARHRRPDDALQAGAGAAPMKVVLLSAAGILGRAMCASTPHGAELLPLARAKLDLTDDPTARRTLNACPDLIISCAA